MNEILTAKEWLGNEIANSNREILNITDKMEEYASYKTKTLEEEFSKYWKETEIKILELQGKLQFIENLIKHFNITTEK